MSMDNKQPSSDDPVSSHDLSNLDADFIRVLEDLIDVLLSNGTLRLTDLPPFAQEKLNQRKQARERMRGALDLLDSNGDDLPI